MSNSWWEIRVQCHADLEETVFWRLEQLGCRGMVTESQTEGILVRGYVPQVQIKPLDLGAFALLLKQDSLLSELPPPVAQWSLIDDEDWSSSWKQYWEPQEIGDRFWVFPAWIDPPADSERLILRLDPAMAFGTGTHPTTQLCLESLEMRLMFDAEKQTIADIGCGSGILSIGGILLGAKQVYSVDTDPLAVKASRENRYLNQIDPKRMIVKEGSLDYLATNLFDAVDGIVCNILAEVIIDMIPQMADIAKPTTWGVLSGILFEQATPIAEALENNGWVVAALWRRKEWCCFNIRRAEN